MNIKVGQFYRHNPTKRTLKVIFTSSLETDLIPLGGSKHTVAQFTNTELAKLIRNKVITPLDNRTKVR